MKIVLAHKYFYRGGGTATYLFALMEELQRRGHQCVPFTVAYDQTVPREYWEYYVSPPAGSDVTHLKDMRLSAWGKLKLLGRATWSREAYQKALRLVDDLQPDLAYVHNLYSYMSPSPIAAFRRRGLPVVMRVPDYNLVCPGFRVLRDDRPCLECVSAGYHHALRWKCHKGSLTATAARVLSMYVHKWARVYGNVDLFLTPSAFMKDVLIAAGFDGEKVVHLPSFYSPKARPAGRRPGSGDYILYFGSIAKVKGIDVAIRALTTLDTPVPLLIAGRDQDYEETRLRQLTAELGLADRVRFVGFQQPPALSELIAGALFVVVPSRWYDNCPMSVLEAFSHGKAVVASAIGGIPEQVAPGTGLLFEPGDWKAMGECMVQLLADPSARERMGQAALGHLQQDFSLQGHLTQLLGIFEGLLAA